MGKGTFYGLSMKTPVIYAEIQVLLMHEYSQQRVSVLYSKLKINCVATVPVHLQKVSSREAFKRLTDYSGTMLGCESSQNQY